MTDGGANGTFVTAAVRFYNAAVDAEQGKLLTDFTPDEIAGILMATMNGLLSEWLRSGRCFSLSDLGNRFLRKQMALFRAPVT